MQLFLEVHARMPDPARFPGIVKTTAKRPMERAGNRLVWLIRERIMKGVPPALKKTTEDKKKARKLAHPETPLYALGILYRAIHFYRKAIPGMTESGAVGIIQRGKPDRRYLAALHHDGAGRLPERKFMYISRSDRAELDTIWDEWFRYMMSQWRTAVKYQRIH